MKFLVALALILPALAMKASPVTSEDYDLMPPTEDGLSNAVRLARGFGPARPKRLYGRSRIALAPRASTALSNHYYTYAGCSPGYCGQDGCVSLAYTTQDACEAFCQDRLAFNFVTIVGDDVQPTVCICVTTPTGPVSPSDVCGPGNQRFYARQG